MSTLERSDILPAGSGDDHLVVSVVIPCLNEEENIEACVRSALEVMEREGIRGEVVVADNNSEDRSAELARAAGRTW
jgi:glycosyltransferase involved in cell wall biosynthesis